MLEGSISSRGLPDSACTGRPTAPARARSEYKRSVRVVAVLFSLVSVICLVIAIAGGTIIHPVLFVLGVVALLMFLMRARHA